ncbi:MAG: Peptide deformylase [uncultured bacterium]|nr:MAG: Peptide deformylase [uncultured bacterium]HBY74101.1 peptide deformylase [Candidatus Kerfeldbacteria bacterium]
MSVLPLVTQPNAILKRASLDLPQDQLSSYQALGANMVETMLASNGIGLAASQIGQNVNLFVIHKDIAETPDHLVLANPEIIFSSRGTDVMEEGCLSCPKKFGDVRRSEKVRVKVYTLDGKKKIYKATGMLAKVFQHEIDHLRGTLIIDKFKQ